MVNVKFARMFFVFKEYIQAFIEGLETGMALLQVNNLNKFYGATPILQGASLEVQAGEKLGLVGRNGCGKTTLLSILTHECDYDSGAIHWTQDTRVGYLRQEPEFQEDCSVYEELRGIFSSLDQLELQLNEIQQRLTRSRFK